MSREPLPQRRLSRTLEFDHVSATGATTHFTATVGYYDDGRVGEVFLGSVKVGTDLDVAAKDSAIAMSLALQHGCPLERLRTSFLRDALGRPESPLGTLIDIIADELVQPAAKQATAVENHEANYQVPRDHD